MKECVCVCVCVCVCARVCVCVGVGVGGCARAHYTALSVYSIPQCMVQEAFAHQLPTTKDVMFQRTRQIRPFGTYGATSGYWTTTAKASCTSSTGATHTTGWWTCAATLSSMGVYLSTVSINIQLLGFCVLTRWR